MTPFFTKLLKKTAKTTHFVVKQHVQQVDARVIDKSTPYKLLYGDGMTDHYHSMEFVDKKSKIEDEILKVGLSSSDKISTVYFVSKSN